MLSFKKGILQESNHSIYVHLYFVRYELLFGRSLVRRHNPHFPKLNDVIARGVETGFLPIKYAADGFPG